MAKWANEKKLSTLKASQKGNIIVFSAGKEKAEVHMKGSDIAKVVYTHAGTKTVVQNKDFLRQIFIRRCLSRVRMIVARPRGVDRVTVLFEEITES